MYVGFATINVSHVHFYKRLNMLIYTWLYEKFRKNLDIYEIDSFYFIICLSFIIYLEAINLCNNA